MNGKKVLTKVKPVAEKIINDLGYELVDLEYKKQVTGMVLELFIDCPNGISINDCEKVSHALDLPLDELNPTEDMSYDLKISSLGLDRPITTEYQFKKYQNSEIELKFYEPLKPINTKTLIAQLKDWNNDFVTVFDEKTGQTIEISKKQIAQIVPVVKF